MVFGVRSHYTEQLQQIWSDFSQLKMGKAGDIGILATDSWSTAFPNAFQGERDIKLMFFIPLSFKRFVCRMIADSWVGFYCYDIISL